MDAVLLAVGAGVCFGGLAVAIRLGLARYGDAEAGALASIVVAFAFLAAAVAFSGTAVGAFADVWPFLAAGAIVPGAGQVLFVAAVRDIGSSRTAVVVGSAPVLAALLAVVFLGEPLSAALWLGTVLIVLGGGALASERLRPTGFRAAGIALAVAAAALIAVRDNILREVATGTDVHPLVGSAALLLGGGVVLGAYLTAVRGARAAGALRRAALPFLAAGVLFGLAYVGLVEAYERGRVTVVSPLIATESLWAVLLSVLVLRRTELVGARLVGAAALVVVGGMLIGATR